MAPILPLLIGGGAVAAILLLMKKDGKAAASEKFVEKVKEAEATKNPEKLKEAAAIAKAEGNKPLAEATKKRYDGMRVEQGKVTYKSPAKNISPAAWTKFVNIMKGPNPKAISPSFALGLFGFGARRLVDLKVMTNPHIGTYKGKKVWTGKWVPPLDINKFLADSALQYKLFARSCQMHAAAIMRNPTMRAAIGATIDGTKLTLSGLLALVHKAGFLGAQKWLKDPAERRKYTSTTALVKKANGIF